MSDFLKTITDRWIPPSDSVGTFEKHQDALRKRVTSKENSLSRIDGMLRTSLGLDDEPVSDLLPTDGADPIDNFLEKVRFAHAMNEPLTADPVMSETILEKMLDDGMRIGAMRADVALPVRREGGSLSKGELMSRMNKLLEALAPSCLADEESELSKAIQALDLTLFCQLAERIVQRRAEHIESMRLSAA